MNNIFLYGGVGMLFLIIAVIGWLIFRRLKKKQERDVLYWAYQDMWLEEVFDNYDVAVYGFRGSGKDVLFAHAIELKGAKHYSNIWYNELTEVRDLTDLHVGGNLYPDFIEGNIKRFEPNFDEGAHFFISDAGVYLGCQFNKELNQNFGELPIHIALRRHLYNSHVHTNSQALNRVWDKLREQQGCFIHCLGTVNYGDFLIVSTITYSKYESALACLPPPKKPNKHEVLRNGEILERRFKVPINALKYDSRHFKSILHNENKEDTPNEPAKFIV